MPGIILGFKIENRSLFRGLGARYAGIVKDILRETATYWHRAIFPRHFGNLNRSRYQLAPRNRFYAEVLKPKKGRGEGRFVDEVLTGVSQRMLLAFFSVTGTAKKATVKAQAPTYFTNPFIGSFTDPRTGRLKHVTRQPDKPDEVSRFHELDRAELRDFAAARMQARLNAARAATTKTFP